MGGKPERLSIAFSVLSSHSRGAHAKARAVFIRNFGQEGWDRHIQPFEDRGIMAVFNEPPNFYTMFYVAAITMMANGDVDIAPGIPWDDAEEEEKE